MAFTGAGAGADNASDTMLDHTPKYRHYDAATAPRGVIRHLLPGMGTDGIAGFPRRYADPYIHPYMEHLMPMNQFITICAVIMGVAQFILIGNFIASIFVGKKAGRNPWNANGLEWTAPSPPGHGNFDILPVVYRGPYEYSSPLVDDRDYLMQTEKLTPPDSKDDSAEDSSDDSGKDS